MSTSLRNASVHLGLAGLIAATLTLPACADSVRVKQVVSPAILVTISAGRWLDETASDKVCFPFVYVCSSTPGASSVLDAFNPGEGKVMSGAPAGTVVVGFEHHNFPGTEPCPCKFYTLSANRGVASFRTRDLPPDFVTATLVLTAVSKEAVGHSFAEDIVSAVFETVPDTLFVHNDNEIATFRDGLDDYSGMPGLSLLFDPTRGQSTVLLQVAEFTSDPAFATWVLNTGGNVLVKKSGSDYRINVTNQVRSWVKNWPNHTAIPAHAFILIGQDETLPTNADSSSLLWAAYNVTLEFDIDEPDR